MMKIISSPTYYYLNAMAVKAKIILTPQTLFKPLALPS